jgi:hypothetical protein
MVKPARKRPPVATQIIFRTGLEVIMHEFISASEFAQYVFDRDHQAVTAARIMRAILGAR